jgi:hypothetical protein
MRYTPPIRSALLGISGAVAALLIGFTPSGASAATHAHAQQPRPIAATHTTGPQSITRKADKSLPCGTVESTAKHKYGSVKMYLVNIRSGPDYGCPVVGQANQYDPVEYYCGYGGWTYLNDLYTGVTGWMVDEALHAPGGKVFCGFGFTK